MGEQPDRVAMLSDLQNGLHDLTRDLKGEIKQLIAKEGETTRRHFDIMVERVEAAVKLVAEVNSHHAVVLDDHETRLKQIEKRRG